MLSVPLIFLSIFVKNQENIQLPSALQATESDLFPVYKKHFKKSNTIQPVYHVVCELLFNNTAGLIELIRTDIDH